MIARDPATRHALAVFGGALGLVLIVGAIAVGIAEFAPARAGCARCWAALAGIAVAALLGVFLVRGGVRAMRADERG